MYQSYILISGVFYFIVKTNRKTLWFCFVCGNICKPHLFYKNSFLFFAEFSADVTQPSVNIYTRNCRYPCNAVRTSGPCVEPRQKPGIKPRPPQATNLTSGRWSRQPLLRQTQTNSEHLVAFPGRFRSFLRQYTSGVVCLPRVSYGPPNNVAYFNILWLTLKSSPLNILWHKRFEKYFRKCPCNIFQRKLR